MVARKILLSVVIAVCLSCVCAAGGWAKTVYVSTTGSWENSGLSWAEAKRFVHEGVTIAVSGDEVWVAAGTYYECITLKNGVGLYGGFPSAGGDWSQRDPSVNVTVLDGNDAGSVVTLSSGAATIDGFTIRNGDAEAGGGIRCDSADLTVSNNTITGNWARGKLSYVDPIGSPHYIDGFGAGVYCSGASSVVINNNTITDNHLTAGSNHLGGGIYCDCMSAAITDNMISANNSGTSAAALYCSATSSATVADNVIVDNLSADSSSYGRCNVHLGANVTASGNRVASNSGGGISCAADSVIVDENLVENNTGSGILASSVSPKITCNVVRGNTGSGIACSASSAAVLNNVVMGNCSSGINCYFTEAQVVNNTVTGNMGPGVSAFQGYTTLSNNIIAYNSSGVKFDPGQSTPGYYYVTLRNNCVYNPGAADYMGVGAGAGDLSLDPKLAAYSYGQVHIQPDSPCIDAGINADASLISVDLDGQSRLQDGDGNGTTIVDIGADESDGTVWDYTPTVIRVKPTGNDANDGSGWDSSHAKRTIQAGIDAAAVSGGEVWVAQGTYTGPVELKMLVHLYGGFAGTETQREQRDPSLHTTIIDGGAQSNVVTVDYSGRYLATIDGFTIRNGNYGRGGGIHCYAGAPRISNNIITQNNSGYMGGGIYCEDAFPEIVNNTISSNTAQFGGGIHCVNSEPRIAHNTITGNTSTVTNGKGGGVCNWTSSCHPVIEYNTITGNSANQGGGVYYGGAVSHNVIAGNFATGSNGCGGGVYGGRVISYNVIENNTASSTDGMGGGLYGGVTILANTIRSNSANKGGGLYSSGAPDVENNIFDDNNSTQGGGVYNAGMGIMILHDTFVNNTATDGGAIYCSGSSSIYSNIIASNSSGICKSGTKSCYVRNNCIYNQSGYDYSGVSNEFGQVQNNISVDPLFVDASAGDYHIQPGSPCIDAGSTARLVFPPFDMDGEGRVYGPAADIGADEYWPAALNIANLKCALDGAKANGTGLVVTAAFPGCFYIEADDRSSGIRVEKSGHGVSAGARVDITGVVGTTADSERCIIADSVVASGTGSIKPLAMPGRSIGGGDYFLSTSSASGKQLGSAGAVGLNNIGLLIRTWGKIVERDPSGVWFRIDDGSGSLIKCVLPQGMTLDPAYDYVSVNGVVSCEKVGEEMVRIVLVRGAGDVIPLQ